MGVTISHLNWVAGRIKWVYTWKYFMSGAYSMKYELAITMNKHILFRACIILWNYFVFLNVQWGRGSVPSSPLGSRIGSRISAWHIGTIMVFSTLLQLLFQDYLWPSCCKIWQPILHLAPWVNSLKFQTDLTPLLYTLQRISLHLVSCVLWALQPLYVPVPLALCQFWDHAKPFQPQGLCICCSLPLEYSCPSYPAGSFWV